MIGVEVGQRDTFDYRAAQCLHECCWVGGAAGVRAAICCTRVARRVIEKPHGQRYPELAGGKASSSRLGEVRIVEENPNFRFGLYNLRAESC